jgi:hypothetical protein
VPRTYPTQGGPGSFPLCEGGHRERLPDLAPAGVDLPHLAGLRVTDRDDADVRQLQLARVDDLHREDLVLRGQLAHRALPGRLELAVDLAVLGGEEVGHDHPQSTLALRPGHRLECSGQIAAVRLPSPLNCSASSARSRP